MSVGVEADESFSRLFLVFYSDQQSDDFEEKFEVSVPKNPQRLKVSTSLN
jgi:hypothetical protein